MVNSVSIMNYILGSNCCYQYPREGRKEGRNVEGVNGEEGMGEEGRGEGREEEKEGRREKEEGNGKQFVNMGFANPCRVIQKICSLTKLLFNWAFSLHPSHPPVMVRHLLQHDPSL